MEFKNGQAVVVTKNLGPKNKDRPGNKDQYYYYQDTGNTQSVKLGSRGKIIDTEDGVVYVILDEDKDEDNELPFHPDELKLKSQMAGINLTRIPENYVFTLASQKPVFLLNDRLYVLDGSGENSVGFFQVSDDNNSSRQGLVESATLSSLEELTQAHYAKEFDRSGKKYLQEVVEDKSQINNKSDKYKMLDFIVNDVFSYFRETGVVDSKIGKILGGKAGKMIQPVAKPTRSVKQGKVKPSEDEKYFLKLITNIEKEKLSQAIVETKTKKLDALLGYSAQTDIADFSQDYEPSSLIGRIIGGRNIAIVDNKVYNLVQTSENNHKRVLSFGGKSFALVSPKPLEELRARYDFELSRQLRTGLLKNKIASDRKLETLVKKSTNFASLARKEKYSEGEFGFIKCDEDNDSTDFDEGEEGDQAYWVFLQVPKHALKMPDDYESDGDDGQEHYDDTDEKIEKRIERMNKQERNKCYVFDKVRVAVRVYLDESGNISYNYPPVTVEDQHHPFAMDSGEFGSICLGHYHHAKLRELSAGEAVAKLLVDTRNVLLAGYINVDTYAATSLQDFDDGDDATIMTVAEARRRNIPVTNINIK